MQKSLGSLALWVWIMPFHLCNIISLLTKKKKKACRGSRARGGPLFYESDSLRPHGLQHARTPCPSPTPRVYLNSCPLSQWCHPTISFSVILFSSRLQSFPASGSFPMSQFFASSGQSIGVSASESILPLNIQDWFTLGWIGWISWQSKGLSRVFRPQFKSINSLALSLLYGPTFTSVHDYWESHSFGYMDLCWQSDGRDLCS